MNFIFTPLGRLMGSLAALLAAIGAIYAKGRSDGKDKVRTAATADALRRTQSAVAAGNAVSRDPAKLRDSDGFRRD